MTRFASALNQTEADANAVTMCVMVSLDFASGVLNLHDGIGTITDSFASPTVSYLGVGAFGGIEGAVQDSLSVIARPIKLTLTGVDSAVISESMASTYQGRDAVIYLGFVRNGQLIAAPETLWEGRMDYMEIEFGKDSGTIRVNCEHRLRREPRIARYTAEDQKIDYPTDTFFDLLSKIQGFKSQWGDERTEYGRRASPPSKYIEGVAD